VASGLAKRPGQAADRHARLGKSPELAARRWLRAAGFFARQLPHCLHQPKAHGPSQGRKRTLKPDGPAARQARTAVLTCPTGRPDGLAGFGGFQRKVLLAQARILRFLSNHIAIKAMAGKLPVTRESGPTAAQKNGTLQARYFSEKQLFRPYPEYTCDIPGFLGQRRFYAAFKPGRIIIY